MGFADWWIEYVNSLEANDVHVTPDTALTYSSVWQAVNIIASDVACAPLVCQRVENDGDLVPDRGNQWNYLLNMQPNEVMTGYTMRETVQAHALLWGDGVIAIERDSNFQPRRLIPLQPHRTEIHLVDGNLIYEAKIQRNETEEPQSVFLPASEVLHIVGLSYTGYSGYQVWRYHREAIGLGLGSQKHSKRVIKNNAVPSVALKTEAMLSEEEADGLLNHWERKHGGENAGNTAIAAGGLEIVPLSQSNRDNEHMDTRKFQRVEIASIFNLPPHKLGDDSRLAYNSLEAEEKSYLRSTLKPWFSRWESEANCKMLTEPQKRRGTKRFLHDTSKLVEGDTASMADIAVKLVSAEIATRNEMRRKFGLPMSDDPMANELRNPNTRNDDTATADEPEEEQTESPDAQQLRQAHINMIRDKWQRNIETDVGKVRRAAKTAKNFVSWLDTHYASTQTKIDESMELIVGSMQCFIPGVSYTPGEQYAEDSKNILLDVAGSCVSDLHERVVEATDTWHDRVTVYLPEDLQCEKS